MKPSVLSTSSTRSRCLEPGIETLDLLRICALRIRAIMSPIGSFTAIAPSSPARLHKARDEAFGAKLAQRDAAQAMLAVIRARTPAELAAVADARLRRIARYFGKLQGRSKTLFHRQLLVVRDRLELRAPVGKFLCHPTPPVVLLDRTLLRHTFAPCGSAYEGLASLPEREVKRGQQRARFFVVARARANGDVEAPGIGHLVEIDLREHGIFLDAEAVIAAAVETLRIEAAEIAHARERDVHQPVDKVVHATLAQRDLAADGLTVAQLVGGDRLSRLGDYRLLTGDQRQVIGGTIHLLTVGDTLADAHVEHDLRDLRHLHAIGVTELLGELLAHGLLEMRLHARDIVRTLARLFDLRSIAFGRAAVLGAFGRALGRLFLFLGLGALMLGISHRSRLRNAWRCALFCASHPRRRT